jgi:hypothetical protein
LNENAVVRELCSDQFHEQRNAQRSDAGWVLPRDRLHGRVVDRRSVVEMAPHIIAIRRSTDERRTQTRVASKRVRVLLALRVRADPLRHRSRPWTTIFVADA